MQPCKIAIVGTGAVCGVLAEALAPHHHVILCARTPFERLAVTTPDGVVDVPTTVCANPEEAPDVDWVVLTTKIPDVPSAEPWLRRFDAARTPLVIMQNGIEHEESVAGFGLAAPLLPALIFVGAERTSPGQVVRRSSSTVLVPRGELGERFAALIEHAAMTVKLTSDFHTATWRKMLWNLAANPITALTLRRLEVFGEPDIRELAGGVLAEAVAVAQAEGANLSDRDSDTVLASYAEMAMPGNGTSMLYDRLAGNRMEHEQITGPVVRAGARHGVPTPLNQTLLTLLRALDSAG